MSTAVEPGVEPRGPGRVPGCLAPVVVVLAGAIVSVVFAVSFSFSTHDALILLAWSAGGAALAGLAAFVVLSGLRRAKTGTQTVIVALAPVVAVGLGVVGGAKAMFLSDHDLRALTVILTGAGTVAVLAAIGLGRRVATASRSVTTLARGLGSSPRGSLLNPASEPTPLTAQPWMTDAPGELAALAQELEMTSQRLAATKAQAEALERGRRELVAWVSHDLRTPSGSKVRVEAGLAPDGTRARLSVIDGCGGIDSEEIERVFDLAYRGDAARSADTGGGGLGLAVARGLVEAHAGDISVHNGTDGCRFVVDLPLRHEAATPDPAG